jgi:hypothetical protein
MDQPEYDLWSMKAVEIAATINNNEEHLTNTLKLFS